MSFPTKFTGKERDAESGLDYFGARYNASTMGRFMSPDPLAGHVSDPQTAGGPHLRRVTRIVRCRQRRKRGCAPSRAFREGALPNRRHRSTPAGSTQARFWLEWVFLHPPPPRRQPGVPGGPGFGSLGWKLHPIRRRIRHACDASHFTLHCRSINSFTLAVVHFLYPSVPGPRFN